MTRLPDSEHPWGPPALSLDDVQAMEDAAARVNAELEQLETAAACIVAELQQRISELRAEISALSANSTSTTPARHRSDNRRIGQQLDSLEADVGNKIRDLGRIHKQQKSFVKEMERIMGEVVAAGEKLRSENAEIVQHHAEALMKGAAPDDSALKKKLHDMNVASREFWDRESTHFERLAEKYPHEIEDVIDRTCKTSAALSLLMNGVKRFEDADLLAIKIALDLSDLASMYAQMRKVEERQKARGRLQTQAAVDKRNKIGDESKTSVKNEALKLLEKHPTLTRDEVAEGICSTVNLSFDTTQKHLKSLRLFRRRRRTTK